MGEIPEDIMKAAEACYRECEYADSGEIVECIARYINAERNRDIEAFKSMDDGASIFCGFYDRRTYTHWIEKGDERIWERCGPDYHRLHAEMMEKLRELRIERAIQAFEASRHPTPSTEKERAAS